MVYKSCLDCCVEYGVRRPRPRCMYVMAALELPNPRGMWLQKYANTVTATISVIVERSVRVWSFISNHYRSTKRYEYQVESKYLVLTHDTSKLKNYHNRWKRCIGNLQCRTIMISLINWSQIKTLNVC